jgi:signal transduction histidine kinase
MADCFVLELPADMDAPAVREVAHVDPDCQQTLEEHFSRAASDDRERDWPVLGTILDGASATAVSVPGNGLMLLAAQPARAAGLVDVLFAKLLANRIASAIATGRMCRALTARDRASRVVSHDLGNPLATIEMCANTLVDGDASPTDARRAALVIQQSAIWIRSIVQDLSDRARLDAGTFRLERRPTQVAEVLATALALLTPVADARGVRLMVECASDLPPVDADPRRLLQILSNLVGNAMRFTPVDGRVVMRARATAKDPGVRIAVSDTGTGMRARRNGIRSGQGLGLGIVTGLVEAHGGRVGVNSALGAGTTVWFTVPAARETEPV